MRREERQAAGQPRDESRAESFRSYLPYNSYLSAILAIALVLRLPGLRRSLWLDEAYSVMVRSSAEPLRLLTMEGPHPPLYFLLLKLWMGTFGRSEIAVRSLSVVLGVGGVAAIYLFARELYDRRTGLLAAALLSVSTLHVQLSQTARMYSALALFSLLSMHFYVRLLDSDGAGNRFGYVAVSVLLVYTHVYGWFVVLAQTLHLAVRTRRRRTLSPAIEGAKAQATVGLFALPWLGFMLVPNYLLADSSDTGWIPKPDFQVLRDIALAYVNVPTNYPQIALTDVTMALGYAALVLCGAVLAYLFAAEFRERGTLSESTELLVLLVAATVAVPYLVSMTVFPILIVRYGYLGFLGVAVLLARAVTRLPRRTLRIGCAALLVALLLPGLGAYYQTPTAENWAGLSETLNEDDLSNDLVLYDPGYSEPPVTYYLSNRSRQEATAVRSGYLYRVEPALRNGSFAEVWVPTHTAVSEDVRDTLSQSYRRADARSFGEISLVRYVRDGGDGAAADGSRNRSATVRNRDRPRERVRPGATAASSTPS